MKEIETAVELVQTLATNLLTLNRDTRESRPMPVINPGSESGQVLVFTGELVRSDLAHLAEAVALVHMGESKGEDAGFSLTEAARFKHGSRVMKDFYAVVFSNASLLNTPARVKNGEYKAGVTIGEILVTFYGLVFEAEGMGFDGTEAIGYRAHTLSEQKGMGENHLDVVLSPMMEKMRSDFLSTQHAPRTKIAGR